MNFIYQTIDTVVGLLLISVQLAIMGAIAYGAYSAVQLGLERYRKGRDAQT